MRKSGISRVLSALMLTILAVNVYAENQPKEFKNWPAGKSPKEIAGELSISIWTARGYIARLRAFAGVDNVRKLIPWGLGHPKLLRGEGDVLRRHPLGCQCMVCCALDGGRAA